VAPFSVLTCLVHGTLVGERAAKAEALLTPGERSQLAAIVGSERRREWLGGRLVAKLAVCRAMRSTTRWAPRLQEVEVSRREGQAPVVNVNGRQRLTLPISISHCGATFAATVALHRASRVGVDVERVDPQLLEIAQRFCTGDELAWLMAQEDRVLAATLLWSGKESAIKWAAGATLRRRSYVVSVSEDGRSAVVRTPPGWGLAPAVGLRAWTQDGHVITLAYDRAGSPLLVSERLERIVPSGAVKAGSQQASS
jgi:phosphopantetheinyl transferase